jgi:hypothetical protein
MCINFTLSKYARGALDDGSLIEGLSPTLLRSSTRSMASHKEGGESLSFSFLFFRPLYDLS